MLRKFQTPQHALNASVADLARIPGFGTARAEKVPKILDNPHNEKSEITQRTLLDDL